MYFPNHFKPVIIMSKWRRQHRFPWLSLYILPYHPPHPAGFPNYILCLHWADVNKFLLFGQNWYVHVSGPIEERHLLVRLCFSSSVLQVLFVLLGWFYKQNTYIQYLSIGVGLEKWPAKTLNRNCLAGLVRFTWMVLQAEYIYSISFHWRRSREMTG